MITTFVQLFKNCYWHDVNSYSIFSMEHPRNLRALSFTVRLIKVLMQVC